MDQSWPVFYLFSFFLSAANGHFVNLLLGCTSGLNLYADLGPVPAFSKQQQNVGFSWFQTWINGVEGEHTEQLTTIVALQNFSYLIPERWNI